MEKEGEKLKFILKGAGIGIGEAAMELGMTRQNLGYHFRKERVDSDFKEKLFSKYPNVFTNDRVSSIVENELQNEVKSILYGKSSYANDVKQKESLAFNQPQNNNPVSNAVTLEEITKAVLSIPIIIDNLKKQTELLSQIVAYQKEIKGILSKENPKTDQS
ncbi:MAG: hypothetical protein JWR05_3532 [Mucilaginibacter sp.]|nr:hypothetical protein [Mucilaginibacter sp.]